MRRTVARPLGALALLVSAACFTPACADVFGLEELELQGPHDASSPGDGGPDTSVGGAGGTAGAAGDASSEPDASVGDGPTDGKGGAHVEAGDADAADASADATDAAQDVSLDGADAEELPPETGSDSSCPPGSKECQGQCIPTNQPTTGCGSTGCEPCQLPHASAMCDSNLQCAIAQCVLGYEDCNGEQADGCEAALKTDVTNCGVCGTECAYANAQPKCANGVCSMGSCDTGWTDCDGTVSNGCEVATDSDPVNCGGCGNACSFAHASATCQLGSCSLGACSGQYADCDGEPSNGCEVNLQSDPAHCGTCPTHCNPDGGTLVCTNAQCVVSTCPMGFGECDGNPAIPCETNLTNTVGHCGACGNACQFANANPGCTASECLIESCLAPYGNCDGNDSNGCETNTKTSVLHCGSCGTLCFGAQNASPTCTSGTCGVACTTGFGDCDGLATNGCETPLLTSTSHCGACASACSTYANATATCTVGVCGVACNSGYSDCDGVTSNGCETNLLNTIANCGSCGKQCASINGTPSCTSGVCAIACNAGFADCDGLADNGCETNLNTLTSCGACGTVCTNANGPTSCNAGVCAPTCASGFASCDANLNNGCETSLKTVTDCGKCAVSCSFANASASCATGTCTFEACNAGWGNCDGSVANGCETNTKTNVNHCGTCGTVCGGANGVATCSAGVCAITCDSGFGNCDSNATNGCETNLTADVQNCGTCAKVCSFAHATAACFAGTCTLGLCSTGWGDCDNDPSNGCEKDLTTLSDCGACGSTCSLVNATATCTTGTCAIALCTAGYGNCDGLAANGCETNTSTSTSHCGACGSLCNSTNGTPSCTAGSCSIVCSPGFGNCDGNVSNGCEVSLNTTANCGTCGASCTNANGTTSCVSGLCSPSCSAGFSSCDKDPANGCETNTQTDGVNCGVCGAICVNPNGTTSCVAGSCAPVCSEGFASCDVDAVNGCETPITTTANCGTCGTSCTNPNGTTACVSGACIPACTTGFDDCDGNPSNGCETDNAANVNHCGTCGNACTCPNGTPSCTLGVCACTSCDAGTGNCDGDAGNGCETSLLTLSDCGACGVPCDLVNASETCANGTCELVSCNVGWASCDGMATNGCETNTQTSLGSCGACGTVCGGANGTPSCSLGACSIVCSSGFGNCDGLFANGCEASLATTEHCGTCATACTNAHGTSACTNGVCVPTCSTGFEDCDGEPSNGCETSTLTSVSHCGACGTVCVNPNGTTSCAGGVCAPTCSSGWGDCDGNPNNGCMTNTLVSVEDCGECDKTCTNAQGTTSCVNGLCVPVCNAGWADCDGNPSNGCETNTQTSVTSCGACGAACSNNHATPTCSLGSCAVTCASGYGDCDSNVATGCETALDTLSNCGGCAITCTNPHGQTSCLAGTCAPACQSGWGNCDGNAVNGCETALTTVLNCAACGTLCERANATASCGGGTCEIDQCNAGWADCDGNDANGCEAPLNTLANCGACGAACSLPMATASCSSGTCQIASCNPGWGNCDGIGSNGCETALNTTSNCGACGTSCTNTQGTTSCVAGVCTPTCAPGWGDCDNIGANGCETSLNTLDNCGACGSLCAPANATGSCVLGACLVQSCAAGYANCDANPANGCEIDLLTNVNNCGVCGRICGGQNVLSKACSGGKCTSSCNLGFANCNLPATSTDDGCERNVSSDHNNCGGCANHCTGGLSCNGGSRPVNRCGCDSSGDCTQDGVCNTSTGICTCGTTACQYGEICKSGSPLDTCSCNGGVGCASGQTCCQAPAGCKDLQADPTSCGACGRVCPPGFVCATGACKCNGNASCDAGSNGTCQGDGTCKCSGTTCAAGKRCLPGGMCG